ncbi:AI-2E family transporter [Halobacteriales archaeon SW_7_68_16]|nr:MAG: AI-2E family transporter [Halobacteriales archaeon SW_7_68_16]
METEFDRGPMWVAGGLFLFAAVLYVLYSYIGTFVFGVFFYYATRPVYRRLRKRIGLPAVAAAASLSILAVLFVVPLLYTLAIGIREGRALANRFDVADVEALLGQYATVSSIARNPSELLSEPASRELLQSAFRETLTYAGLIGNGLLHFFIMIVIAYYLLKDGGRIARWLRTRFGDDRGVMDAYVRVVDRDFSNIFFGNLLNAFLTAVIGALTYSLLDVFAPTGLDIPQAALVGILTGAGSLVPVVGMKIIYFPVAAYLGFTAYQLPETGAVLWFPIAFVMISFVIVDAIPDLVLRPYVSGRNLHVGAVMLAYIVGPLLFGWYGLFLGPMLLVLVVHFARIVLPELLGSQRIAPYSVDPTYIGADPPTAPESAAPTDRPVTDGAGDATLADDPDGVTKSPDPDERHATRDESDDSAASSGGPSDGANDGDDPTPD